MGEVVCKKNSFSVEDIREVRNDLDKLSETMSSDEFIKYINKEADEVKEKISERRRRKLAM